MPQPKEYVELTYNRATHRYIPNKEPLEKALATKLDTLSHMFDGTGESLTSEIESWLTEVSDSLYDWIYSETPIDNHSYIEYMLAYDTDTIKVLWSAIIEQARYDIRSSGLLIGTQHGVNIERAKLIDRKLLRGRIVISDGAEKKLKKTGLLTSVSLPYTIPRNIYRVEY